MLHVTPAALHVCPIQAGRRVVPDPGPDLSARRVTDGDLEEVSLVVS